VFERVDIDQLRRHVPLQLEVAGGGGALRTWMSVDAGRVSGVTVDVALSQSGLQAGPRAAGTGLGAAHRPTGRPSAGQWFEAYTQGLRFDTVDGLHWPGGRCASATA